MGLRSDYPSGVFPNYTIKVYECTRDFCTALVVIVKIQYLLLQHRLAEVLSPLSESLVPLHPISFNPSCLTKNYHPRDVLHCESLLIRPPGIPSIPPLYCGFPGRPATPGRIWLSCKSTAASQWWMASWPPSAPSQCCASQLPESSHAGRCSTASSTWSKQRA